MNDILFNYAASKNFGIPFTFTQDEFNKFKLTTIKNVMKDGSNIGYLAITENANDIKAAIETLFQVKVVGISTMNPPRRSRRVGRFSGKRAQVKKAIVRLAEGNSIQLFPDSES